MNPASDPLPIEVDARGLRCPLPVIRLAEAARDAPDGAWIVVLATDPAARHDIPAWCRMRNCELTELTEMGEKTEVGGEAEVRDMAEGDSSGTDASTEAEGPRYLRFVVQTRPQPSKAGGSASGSERSSRAR